MPTATSPAAQPPEADLVERRRIAAGLGADADLHAPAMGLALSGGGIRSATFCLGLVRALARNGVLRRFDYLSTVSGGGYVGAAIGRLYQPSQQAAAVEAGLQRDDSLLVWWLRNNGRYLTPAGVRDMGQAAASILRGVLSTHFEVALLVLLAASVLLLPSLAAGCGPAAGQGADVPNGWCAGGSAWWWLAAVPAFLAAHQVFAYWMVREHRPFGQAASNWLAAALCALVALQLLRSAALPSWALVAALLLATPLTAALLGMKGGRRGATTSAARLVHTKRLALALWALGGCLLAALLEAVTRRLAAWLLSSDGLTLGATLLSPAAVAAASLAVRSVLPAVQRWRDAAPRGAPRTGMLLNIAGLLLLVALVVAWTTALQIFVAGWPGTPLADVPAGVRWASVPVIAAGYIYLTRNNFELLNLSSLHNFYRARIERAYVSAGNFGRRAAGHARFGDTSPLEPARNRTESVARLIDAVEGDDVGLADYRPHMWGGPIHLVNICINQTVDDRTGNYNADRKGIALTVSALGIETGTAMPEAGPPPGPLSRWVAISGAAASSGMGSRTSPGLAALLFLSGLRLGYWTLSLLAPQAEARVQSRAAGAPRKAMAGFPKPSAILSELLARFPGLRSPAWYLSDGGHFDNTGVYALLKRRVRTIVLADVGADPDYRFEDLENLVRKAGIDHGADIAFIDPAHLPPGILPPALRQLLATPTTMEAGAGPQSLLLASIRYADGSPPGTLVVVKPRCPLAGDAPLSMAAYAQRHPLFPQQPTGDQFFDEAQWEAYYQLGLQLGGALTPASLAAATACVQS